MEPLTVLALMGSIVYAVVNAFRYLAGKQYGRAATLLVVWVVGALVVALTAASDFGGSVDLGFLGMPDRTLDSINIWSQIMVGFAIGSAFSGVNDLLAALDSSRNSDKPELFASANKTPDAGTTTVASMIALALVAMAVAAMVLAQFGIPTTGG